MVKVKANKEIKELINQVWREKIAEKLRYRRDKLAVKVLVNVHMDEKIYSETDFAKREIRWINSILDIPKIVVEIDEEISEQDLIARADAELDVWPVEDLFKTHD